MWQRKYMCLLFMPVGVTGVLVNSLASLFSYTPNSFVPFPYIPPPQGNVGAYIETSDYTITSSLAVASKFGNYSKLFPAELYKGQSFIFKKFEFTEWMEGVSTETYVMAGGVQFVSQDPSDLKKLKAGDTVDIICVCAGLSKEWPEVPVFENCQFLPAGVAPLPLPGGPAPITGGY